MVGVFILQEGAACCSLMLAIPQFSYNIHQKPFINLLKCIKASKEAAQITLQTFGGSWINKETFPSGLIKA